MTQGTNLSGIHSLLGQSLSSLLGTNFSGSSSFSLQPDNYGGLGGQVLLLKVSDKEYWLLELLYLDTEIGILELAFAKVSAQGRAEIPEAGFEQGPVDTEKSGGIANYFLMYGDGLCLTDASTSDTTLACNDEQLKFAFDFDGSVADIDDGVHLRYAGDDFFENIETLDDLEAYFNDASSIPVRLDGRGSTTFVKLSYDKQKRSYTMSSEASSATALEHNDLIGVCLSGNMESSACPDYVFRVVRMAPEDDLYANMFLELQSIRFSTPAQGDDYRKQVIGEKSDYPNFPELSDNGTVATKVIFDGDYDGVPWLFDPNDEDPNIPGSPSSGEDDFGPGLSVTLVNKYSYKDTDGNNVGEEGGEVKRKADNSTIYTTRLLIETRDLYLGDVDNITLTSAELGMSGSELASCQPPKEEFGEFIDTTCKVTEQIASGLKVAPSLAFQSYEGIGIFLAPKSSCSHQPQGQGNQLQSDLPPTPGSSREPLDVWRGSLSSDAACQGQDPHQNSR